MPKFRLQSAPMVHTPGLIRAARKTAKTDFDYWLRVFVEGYSLPVYAARALIRSEVDITIQGGDVLFEVDDVVHNDKFANDDPNQY
jgi:hypothetical protein